MKQPIWGIATLALVGLAACSRAPDTATTQQQLTATQEQLAATQQQLTATQQQLAATQPSAPAATPAPLPVAPTRASVTAPAPVASVAAPKPKPAAPPPPRDVTIASGTAVRIRTTNQLSTKTAATGERFTASLETPLKAGGTVVAPKGAEVEGVVSDSDSGGRVKGVASLSLRVDRISIHGKSVPVSTSAYVQNATTSKKKDALKVGIGAGIGAAIGAIAGGGHGAAIGAGAGGAGGTAVVLATKGNPAVVPAETVLAVTLTAPVTVRMN